MATIFTKFNIFGLNRGSITNTDIDNNNIPPSSTTYEDQHHSSYQPVQSLDYELVLYLDADVLAYKDPTSLFDDYFAYSETVEDEKDLVFAAYAEKLLANGPKWEMNAGVLFIKPSNRVFDSLLRLARLHKIIHQSIAGILNAVLLTLGRLEPTKTEEIKESCKDTSFTLVQKTEPWNLIMTLTC